MNKHTMGDLKVNLELGGTRLMYRASSGIAKATHRNPVPGSRPWYSCTNQTMGFLFLFTRRQGFSYSHSCPCDETYSCLGGRPRAGIESSLKFRITDPISHKRPANRGLMYSPRGGFTSSGHFPAWLRLPKLLDQNQNLRQAVVAHAF